MFRTYTSTEAQENKNLLRLTIDLNNIEEDGSFHTYGLGHIGNPTVNEGVTFFIDENTSRQISKLRVVVEGFTLRLELKDGETFEEELSEAEQQLLELERKVEEKRIEIAAAQNNALAD